MATTENSNVFYRNLRSSPTVAVGGRGSYIYDQDGNTYLDAAAGIAVVSIGHGVDEIYQAVSEWRGAIPYVFGGAGFTTEWQERLASVLVDMAPGDMSRVYFSSGGSEANETAIKMARQFHVHRGNSQKHKIISRFHSYHGITLATLSISGRSSWRAPYDPYLFPAPKIGYPQCAKCRECGIDCLCLDTLEDIIAFEGADTISAFIAEPIVGTSNTGIVPPPGYYERVREICDKNDILFIADEVLCGYGRCGKYFAIEYWDAVPDILTTGKGVSSGYAPLGATIASKKVVEAFEGSESGQFAHGFTHSGNPMACFLGLSVYEYARENGLFEKAASMGSYLHESLQKVASKHDEILEVRGKGLLAGVILAPLDQRDATSEIVAAARSKHVLLSPGVKHPDHNGQVDHIQIAPPFCIDEPDIDHLCDVLEDCIARVYQ